MAQVHSACDPICVSIPTSVGRIRLEVERNRAMNRTVIARRLATPVRLALAAEFGDELDGAWWPRSSSVANELPDLMCALLGRLGQITDISVNWSSLEGPKDLDALNRRAIIATPDRETRHHRMMTITGLLAHANLLVVPSQTTAALAKTVMRLAARLPMSFAEQETQVYETADAI